MTETGKHFEEDFKNSAPDYVLVHRLPNPAQAFNRSNNLRFSLKNPFDYLLWDSKRHVLYALELKTIKEKSISFERTKNDAGKIHIWQVEGLNKWDKYDGIICGFVINFREIEKTVFLPIDSYNKLIAAISKKSFSYEDIVNSKLPYMDIGQTKKVTRYTYDIEGLLSQLST